VLILFCRFLNAIRAPPAHESIKQGGGIREVLTRASKAGQAYREGTNRFVEFSGEDRDLSGTEAKCFAS
jgi:hypothetical protein